MHGRNHAHAARAKRLRNPYRRYRQRGVALITVLMVFAIATLIAGKVIVNKSIDVQRVTGMVNRTQAHYYALAAESLAMLALGEDESDDVESKELADDLEELWASGAIPFEIDNIGDVVVQIVDLNRFYNINNLLQDDGKVNDTELERFRSLLVELQLDTELADNLADWLDKDDQESGYQSESDAYLNRNPAYRAANQRLNDISELRLVNGFDPAVMRVLLPHVTAVSAPGVLPLNVNTATEYALTTLQEQLVGSKVEGLGLTGAQNIIAERPYATDAEFNERSGTRNLIASSSLKAGDAGKNPNFSRFNRHYALSSLYYEINVRANYAGNIAYLTTVVRQQGSGDSAKYIVLSRKETDNSQRFAQFAGLGPG